MTEKLKHMEAFEYYYSLGENRSYAKVAQKFNVTTQAVEIWGKNFKWQSRLLTRDLEQGAKLREQTEQTILSEKEKYRKIIQAALSTFVEELKSGKIKVTKINDVISLIELDMKIAGISDNGRNTSDETVNTINQIVASIKNIDAGDAGGVSKQETASSDK